MNDMMTSSLIPSDEAIESRVGTETVILHLENGTYYGLDPVGTRVWALLQEGLTGQAICARMLAEFDVAPEVLEADVRAFLGNLLDHGIITPA